MIENNIVGQRFRLARIEKGLTQKELAQKCGMADSAIRKYESGKIFPKMETFGKISDALELPVSFFLGTGPFKDLNLLRGFKSVVLYSMQENKFIKFDSPISNIDNYEYWVYVGKFIEDLSNDEEAHALHISYKSNAEPPEPIPLDVTSNAPYTSKTMKIKQDLFKASDEVLMKCFKDITDIELSAHFFTIYHSLNRLGRIKAIELISSISNDPRYKI